MKIHEFLESEYVRLNVANQTYYSPRLAAGINAVQNLINLQKYVLRITSYPVVIAKYLGVAIGLLKPPLSAKEQVEAMQEAAKAKQAPLKAVE